MNLFVYGTLMEPRIMTSVAGRAPAPIPARLRGHARYAITGVSYPGMVPEPDGEVSGILYRGLGPGELRRLDAFEGAFYCRRRVRVETVEGERLAAFTYLVRPHYRHRLTALGWDYQAFRERGLEGFVSGYSGFRQR
jgi:gamma-glutamylcyclotransferase (GGCT)/AIG2-like uncharacterized protein YtfP